MKVLNLLICALFIFQAIFPPVKKAGAATVKYARADCRDAYFCERKDVNYALFALPYTYCVEVLSYDGEWYYVKYAEDSGLYRATYGYCLADKLTPVDTLPSNPYLNMPVTVTYRTDAPQGSLPVLSELNVTAAFYGPYYAGATAYSYVLYDGAFGYIYGANDDYPLNEILNVDEEPERETKKGNVKLVVGLSLSAAAIVTLAALYFAGRKRNRSGA